jgi:hypothetical protein
MSERFNLATAIIEIVGDPEKFEAALKKADKDGKNFVTKMGAGFGALAKIAIPAGIIGTIGVLAKNALDAGEQINLMSQRTGVSAENLTRLTYAGGLVNVTLETIGSATSRLARQMAKGEDEMGKSSKALQRMGISATDANGKLRPMLDVILDVSDAFKKMDPATRLNASMEIFGREGGQRMIDVLAMGREELKKLMAESDRVGYTMSTETAEQLDKFGDYIDRANLRLQAMSRTAVIVTIPAVEALGNVFSDDFPQDVEGGTVNSLYYVKRFVIGVVGGFDMLIAGVKVFSNKLGYEIEAIGKQLSNTGDMISKQLSQTFDKLSQMQPITFTETPAEIAAKLTNNLRLFKEIRQTNEKLEKDAVDKNKKLQDEAARMAAEDQEQITTKSLERIQKLWDDYFDHKAKKEKEGGGGGGDRQLTDAEQEAILAVREAIKQREIETATMRGQLQTAYKLKLELIDIEKEKMKLKGIPTKLIDQFATVEQIKALAEFKKASEENSRMVKGEIADQQLAMATAAGLTAEVRRLTQAKIELHVQEMREKGVTEDLIAKWKELATFELDDKLTRQSADTLKAMAAMHRDYAADVLNSTLTEGEKARLAAKDKLDKRLDDLRTFGDAHQEKWVEVLQLEKEAYAAYYAELALNDRTYETSWRSMIRRIGEEAKASGKRTAADMDAFAKNFVTSTTAFVGDEFFNTFTLNFAKAKESARSFFKDLLHQILNFLAQQAVMKFIALATAKWGGAAGATGGTAAQWAALGSGAVQAVGGHRAGGGMVWQRGVYELAEEGPEAVVPTRDGGHIPVKFEGMKQNNSPIDMHQTIIITPDMFAAMRTSPEEIITIVNSDYARNGQTRRTMRVRR